MESSSETGSVRLQKWISQLGLASRRQAEEWIKEGHFKINGQKATLGQKILPEQDLVHLKDKRVDAKSSPPKVYWIFNKPLHTLVSHVPQGDKKTIYDGEKLGKVPFKLLSVGRLDYMTEGLLILSNDGEFVFRLSHPSYKLPREYVVISQKPLKKEDLEALNRGRFVVDGKAIKCQIQQGHSIKKGGHGTARTCYFITIYEGRNRIVRRIFEQCDRKIVKLVRVRFGDIRLPDNLAPGEYRQLTKQELFNLKSSISLS